MIEGVPENEVQAEAMKKEHLPIAAAMAGILVAFAVFAANELTSLPAEPAGINMITAAAVDRAGATIVETKRPSQPRE